MYHYLFTNDLRISNLENFLIDAGKCFVEDRVPTANEDKNANNNMNTLGFYFNLTKDSNCAKYCANKNIRPVILNFIKKFQFPNPRTTESINDSMADNITLAPLRTIIQVLYFMNNINKEEAYLSDTEIGNYIFFNDKIAKSKNPDIISLAKDIIIKRKNNVVLMQLEDDVLNGNGFYWKQCKRQLREMIKILTWSGCAIKDNNGNIKLYNDNLNIQNKAELFDILSYSNFWIPDKNKNANENKKSYQEYMDMEQIAIKEYTTNDLFKSFYFKTIEETIKKCKRGIELRSEFIQEYPLSRIAEMTLDEYALGGNDYKKSLSYKLQFGKYSSIISIGGNIAKKHRVYINKNNKLIVNGIEVTENINETWIEFRNQLYSFLAEYSNIDNPIKAIEKYPMLKGMSMVLTKLLFLYYPEKFTSIASKGKLIDLLDFFNYEYESNSQAEELNFILYKNIRENYEFTNSVDSQIVGNILCKFINEKDFDDTEEHITENEIEKYSKEKFLEEVFIDEEKYNSIVNVLNKKKNIILEGAPGVGKTYMAKRLVYSLMGEKDKNRIEFLQFHQSYSYEDFVEGYRPNDNGFSLEKGMFYLFCKKAEKHKEKDFYLIIDEINRGNLSKIFGELLMLIENGKREETVSLVYSGEKFSVPNNLYIIGLMNTADRSLAIIDYALRRRFSFIRLEPAFSNEKFKESFAKGFNNQFKDIITLIEKLNEYIEEDKSLGTGFKIGHSYFCNIENGTKQDIENIIRYEIIPLLEEYWFDDEETLEKWKNTFNGVIND